MCCEKKTIQVLSLINNVYLSSDTQIDRNLFFLDYRPQEIQK